MNRTRDARLPQPPTTASASPFSSRDFRLLFTGSSISAIGDQFTLVALPWLVLQLTGDPAQLGLVLSLMALPRAAFMLIGGALADRLSPRWVLVNARLANALLTGLLATLVFNATIGRVALYALAMGIGLSTAFAYPAGSSIIPQLVPPRQLHGANSTMMGMRQLSMVVGPAMAGWVISAASATPGGTRATGLALGIDACSFVISVVSLLMIRIASDVRPPSSTGRIFADVLHGLRAYWRDPQLRALISYIALVSALVTGPLQIALPLLAYSRTRRSAAALGILMTSNGAGMLLGTLSSAPVARLAHGRLGVLVLSMDALAGLAFAALSTAHSVLLQTGLLVLIGIFAGTVRTATITWLQQRVTRALLGRTMSLFLFAAMGLAPLAAVFAGALLDALSLAKLLVICGLSLTTLALISLMRPHLRTIQLCTPASDRC